MNLQTQLIPTCTDNENLHNVITRLWTTLDKERKEAQTKVASTRIIKQQFQMQWRQEKLKNDEGS